MWRSRFLAFLALGIVVSPACADDQLIARGAYLASIAGCSDCHTPGGLTGNPDSKRMLGGSDVGFGAPGYGVAVGPNLTPDKQTGLGGWTSDQIIKAITQGLRPDGRVLSGAMPWQGFSRLTAPDAQAIVAYLQSLPAVSNAVPGPFGPQDKPSVAVSVIVSGVAYAAMPPPKTP
jgi:mono/diheme cytochrome c family protein